LNRNPSLADLQHLHEPIHHDLGRLGISLSIGNLHLANLIQIEIPSGVRVFLLVVGLTAIERVGADRRTLRRGPNRTPFEQGGAPWTIASS
jgi:hypothetical protein